jgi:uncharacterized lipoprotein YddW (UPF0748 family)
LRYRGRLLLLAAAVVWMAGACGSGAAVANRPAEVRALWVTRFDYKTLEDVRLIVANAASVGFNTLYFQVRGDGTVCFPSKIEPWFWQLTGDDPSTTGRDPGWDPLATALREAHARGLKLQAYMNVMPAWQDEKAPPPSANQIYTAHPEWLMVDSKGRRMSTVVHGFYAFLNPSLPEVRQHLAALFSDVARHYPTLDGIHYDYIRYPDASEVHSADFSYDPASIAAFKKYSNGKPPAQDPELWIRFKGSRVNLVLGDLAQAIRAVHPGLELSAAVRGSYLNAARDVAQFYLEWPGRNLVDTLVPMAYHYDMAKFEDYLNGFLGRNRPKTGKVIVGIWPAEKWRNGNAHFTPTRLGQQIAMARQKGADGVAIFSYEELFEHHQANAWARYLRDSQFATVAPKIPGAAPAKPAASSDKAKAKAAPRTTTPKRNSTK